MDVLFKTCSVFFAFSNQQFQENKTPLEEGEKYVSIGGGGYCPKSKAKQLADGFEAIDQAYKAAIKGNKQREANILYELQNHEAFYTNSIEDTLEALGEEYTKEEVQNVYRKEFKKQTVNA